MGESNFFSMDKLVEFGMGMAVASQMANSMNKTLRQMEIPGAGKSMPGVSEALYYVVLDGKSEGPFSRTELARLIVEKKIMKETYIWKPGMAQWDLAENVSEVLSLVALTPPPVTERK
jgi:hypothetical protein